MPDYGDLTDLQLMILSVLWDDGEATIGAIHDRLGRDGAVTRKTIATILGRLEDRKLVAHRMDGRESVYRAKARRQTVLRSRLASLVGALFRGNERLAGANALDPADVRAGDVERLIALMRRLERDMKE